MPAEAVRVPPVVSAITIFLDGARFIDAAIESVLAQTFRNWELLLVDDGSTDGATEIAKRYAAEHPDRIRYLQHPGHFNRGMSASRNVGLGEARGRFVAFLDGDDVWMPAKLERQVALMEAHPEAAMICGATRLWHGWTGSPDDAANDAVRAVREGPDATYSPPRLLLDFLRNDALTPATCSVLIRRDALSLTGGFEERFTGLYEDQAFFVKAYLKWQCYVTAEAHDLYRQHPNSHSAVALKTGRFSLDAPSPALTGLLTWCARYFVRERVVNRELWTSLLGRLAGIAMHGFMNLVNRPLKPLYAAGYHLRRALQRKGKET